jgi:hypothetical protein
VLLQGAKETLEYRIAFKQNGELLLQRQKKTDYGTRNMQRQCHKRSTHMQQQKQQQQWC